MEKASQTIERPIGDEGLEFFRGTLIGLAIAIPTWAAIITLIVFLL